MYVQDITVPGANIAAEISKEEAYNFKKMCKLFAADDSHQKVINEYTQKLSLLQSDIKTNGSYSKHTVTKEQIIPGTKIDNHLNFESIFNMIVETSEQYVIEKLICIDLAEQYKEIIDTISPYLEEFDSTLKLLPFGSCQYTLNDSESNLNLFTFTSTPLFSHCFTDFSFCFCSETTISCRQLKPSKSDAEVPRSSINH